MPELPEVETIVQDLQPLINKKIGSFEVFNDNSINLSAVKFRQQILHLSVKSITRFGKHLMFDLGSKFIVIHLKMTGQIIWQTNDSLVVGGHPIIGVGFELPNKFTRVIFGFDDGSRLFFNDVRKFGWVRLLSQSELDDYMSGFGVEPLTSDFSLSAFKEVLRRKANSKIKPTLLDQHKILGIGNIYADESLFLSGIRPMRLVKTLNKAEIKKLWQVIPRILRQAIKYRGTSFNDYVDAKGQSGSFFKHLKVYGRAGKPCLKCGEKIVKIKLAGRGTQYCLKCQK